MIGVPDYGRTGCRLTGIRFCHCRADRTGQRGAADGQPAEPILAERPLPAEFSAFEPSVMMMLMTEWHLDVSLTELRRSFNLLLDHVEATTG